MGALVAGYAKSMRAFGSPTILINGRDVAGNEAAGAASCRVYQTRPGRLAAVPPVELIAAALNSSAAKLKPPFHRAANVTRED